MSSSSKNNHSPARRWSEFATSLRFADIPEPVVAMAKLLVLDTVACALGGYGNGAQRAAERAEVDLGTSDEATIIGSGRRTSALSAILANGAMVRYLDANDLSGGSHDSEVIPAAMAVAEKEGRSGADLLTAVIVGYELGARFHRATAAAGDAVAGKELEARGFENDLRGSFTMPAVYGSLLGLTEDQTAHAIAIAGSRGLMLSILDASKEQNTLAKNVRFPLTAYLALVATYLARHGMTGPTRVFEGHLGFNDVVLGGGMALEELSAGLGDEWLIFDASMKQYCACYATHGHVQAAVDLANRVNLDPDEIDSIRIVTNTRTQWHTGDPDTRRRVFNKETADHSSYYVTAVALLERALGPTHYTAELYADPRVHRLMDVITVDADDAAYRKVYPGARVEVGTKDGRHFAEEVLHPRGNSRNPMGIADISAKLHVFAGGVLSEKRREHVIEAVMSLDRAAGLNDLTSSLVSDRQMSR